MSPTLHYIFDPLCGWCYAASPIVRVLSDSFGADLTLQFHPGLLMPEPRAIEPDFRAHIIEADRRINQLSGVPFGEAYIDRIRNAPQILLHSVPPAAAVMAAVAMQPAKALNLLESIQRAHYVQGQDVSKPLTLSQLAVSQGLDADAFDQAYAAALTSLPSQADAARALMHASGGGGFPTFVLEHKGGRVRLHHASAYAQPALLVETIRHLLAS